MRRSADRWVYWWNLGYRDGLTCSFLRRRIPSLYRVTYRAGWRQGEADRIRSRA